MARALPTFRTSAPDLSAAGWDECRFLTCSVLPVRMACNLRCPTCFANSDVGRFASLDEVERMLDTIVENEGYADVVQFSGGEPTIHPRLIEILAMAKRKRIKAIMINTNGVRLATDIYRPGRNGASASWRNRLYGHLY